MSRHQGGRVRAGALVHGGNGRGTYVCVHVNVFVALAFECVLCVVRMVGGCECVCELYISKT